MPYGIIRKTRQVTIKITMFERKPVSFFTVNMISDCIRQKCLNYKYQ